MLTAYLVERAPVSLLVPISTSLGFAAHAALWPGARGFAVTTALTSLLFLQFRIWDDVADRGADAATHPHRVLVRTPHAVVPVIATGACLALLNAFGAAARGGGRSLGTLLVLNAVFAGWYLRRGARSAAGDHLLLGKYPAFVLIVAGDQVLTHQPRRLLLATAVVYLAACVHEAWHDRSAPAARMPLLVASEVILLVVGLGVLSFGGRS